MAIAHVVSTAKSLGSTGGTSDAVDTTGADLIVLVVAFYEQTQTVSDSNGNIWTLIRRETYFDIASCSLYYCKNATVGAGHTFTVSSAAGGNSSVAVSAFSGANTTAPLDQQNGAQVTFVSTAQPGSITPSQDNCLVAAGIMIGDNESVSSIDGGFTLAAQAGTAFSTARAGIAYLIQTTAAASNPTWTISGSDTHLHNAQASFMPFVPPAPPGSFYLRQGYQ